MDRRVLEAMDQVRRSTHRGIVADDDAPIRRAMARLIDKLERTGMDGMEAAVLAEQFTTAQETAQRCAFAIIRAVEQ